MNTNLFSMCFGGGDGGSSSAPHNPDIFQRYAHRMQMAQPHPHPHMNANPDIEQAGPWERYLIHHWQFGNGVNQGPPNGVPMSYPRPDGCAGWRGRWEQRMLQAHGPAPAVPGAGAGADAGDDA